MATDVRATLATRGTTHGDFSDQANAAQSLKSVMEVYGRVNPIHTTTCQREAIAMICHKLARIATGDPMVKDHWMDIAGYAILVADRLPDPE